MNENPNYENQNPENRKPENQDEGSNEIYSSSEYEKAPNPLVKMFRHFKCALTVDFDKPFSVSDQLIIMFVVLLVSCVLFGFLFGVSRCVNPPKPQELTQADSSQVSARTGQEQSASLAAEAGSEPSQETPSAPASPSSQDGQSSGEEPSSKEEVSEQPRELFTRKEIEVPTGELHSGTLVLVDKECPCYQNGENVAPLMESENIYYDVTDYEVSFDKDSAGYLNKMLEDFYYIYGETDIMIACGYRSEETQARLYSDERDRQGEEDAEQWVAPPGFSEHQTGYAVDLNLNINNGSGGIRYSGEDIYSWINANCYKYGFVVRYPLGKEEITGYSYEPWHFRYVGEPSATYMEQKQLTLEEYLDIVHTHNAEDPLHIEGDNGQSWYVYYCRAGDTETSTLTVPDKLSYTLSGDNYSGFVVTVTASE